MKKGPWPSFVKEIEKSAAKNEQAATLLDLLEDSYEEKRVHWKHGGIVGVRGYGGGSSRKPGFQYQNQHQHILLLQPGRSGLHLSMYLKRKNAKSIACW